MRACACGRSCGREVSPYGRRRVHPLCVQERYVAKELALRRARVSRHRAAREAALAAAIERRFQAAKTALRRGRAA
jgi:hypothetical protein